MANYPFESIAIVGMSALFSGSQDSRGFWRDIINGKDLTGDVPTTHWLIDDYYDPDPKTPDKIYVKRGSFLNKIPFDPIEYGIPPAIVSQTDSTQLLTLVATKQLLTDAFGENYQGCFDPSTMSVILGVTSSQELISYMVGRIQDPFWRKALRENGIPEDVEEKIVQDIKALYLPWQESAFPGLLGNVVAGRIANRFNLGGTNCVVDAACASSLAALNTAVCELQLHRCDSVIVGGADTLNDPFMHMCFSRTPALSLSGDCRPFAKSADGTLLGEGIALFLLKRLHDAERDQNNIYAVIKGMGSSSDGRSKSIYAPVSTGQAKAIQRCYDAAGYTPDTIDMIEGHGTATDAGDIAEFNGLKMIFGDENLGKEENQWCALGSIKSQIGHTKAAAGAASLFKVAMSLRDKVLTPTLKVDEPNPHFELETSPFYLNTMTRPWLKPSGHSRRASFSSFGFGGTNFHVTLEEYTNPKHLALRQRSFPSELIVLSAEAPDELIQYCEVIQEQAKGITSLSYIAKRSQLEFNPHDSCRLAIVAKNCDELADKIDQALPHLMNKNNLSLSNDIYYQNQEFIGKVALLFPGQGSQYLYMGTKLLIAFDELMHYFELLMAHRLSIDESLSEFIYPKPVFTEQDKSTQLQHLTATHVAQPAIAAISLLYLKLLHQLNIHFDCVAGHSFGELTALRAAGSMSDTQLLDLAYQRGKVFASAANRPGGMMAVRASQEELEQLLSQQSLNVSIANYNSPKQHVLSGDQADLQTLMTFLTQQKISCTPLKVANAFHSNYMQTAEQEYSEFLATQNFTRFKVPVYANTTADIYRQEAKDIPKYLSHQIVQPVLFTKQIQNMYAAGVRVFIEVGPQNVLSNFVHNTLNEKEHVAVSMNKIEQHDIHSLWQALAQLATVGVPIDFNFLWDGYEKPISTPKLTAKHILHINGTNYGKPYPLPGGSKDNPKPNPKGSVPSWAQSTLNTVGDDEMTDKQQAIIQALNKIEEEVKASHAKYQQMMQQTLQEFTQNIQQHIQNLKQVSQLGDERSSTSSVNVEPPPAPSTVSPAAPTPPPTTASVPPQSQPSQPEPTQPASSAVPSPQTAATPAAESLDPQIQSVLMEIVAEKTGYPADALDMNMDLEADLGIDSIKRVEILSTVQQKMPNLPALDPNELAVLNTLQQIAEYVASKLGNVSVTAATTANTTATTTPSPQITPEPASAAAANTPTSTVESEGFVELENQLLQIVANKTGYPAEALEMSMDLEADLGIDSIKRVEILSTMQQQVPNLPELDPNDLATLTTLQQIADYVKKKLTS